MKSRTLGLLAVAVLGWSSVAVRAEDDAAVLADFKAFAEFEALRIQVEFNRLLLAGGNQFSTPSYGFRRIAQQRNGHFTVGRYHEMIERYGVDLRRTDSLVTPFVGTIEVYGRSVHGDIAVSNCNSQPSPNKATLAECLDAGATIERDGTRLVSSLSTYRLTYSRQDGKWVRSPYSSTPAKTFVKIEEAGELPIEWARYAGGAVDEPPGVPTP